MYFELNQTTIIFDFNVPTLDCSTIVQKYNVKNRQDYFSKMSEFASTPDFTLSFATNTPWFSFMKLNMMKNLIGKLFNQAIIINGNFMMG